MSSKPRQKIVWQWEVEKNKKKRKGWREARRAMAEKKAMAVMMGRMEKMEKMK